jgi:hypothetical protein
MQHSCRQRHSGLYLCAHVKLQPYRGANIPVDLNGQLGKCANDIQALKIDDLSGSILEQAFCRRRSSSRSDGAVMAQDLDQSTKISESD